MDKGTEGEKFVNDIAFQSFMQYWCYPSPKDESGDKKEICDLLIIFGNSLIIISVKNYEFKENYTRYFRRTIEKAVKQIYGAERKLLRSTNDVFIKHPNKELEKFPKENIENVFRVIVNLGEGVKFYPFNRETKDEKFITLFDKEAFQTIVKELDTIPDFIEYLSKREEVFIDKDVTILPGEEEDFSPETSLQFFNHTGDNLKSNEKIRVVLSGTEHDLLAHYLENKKNFPEELSSGKSDIIVLQNDGRWNDFVKSKRVLKKKELDEKSYFIDELVKHEILIAPGQGSEELAKELLSFDRFNRRMISNNFFEFYETYKENKGLNFARRYGDVDGKGIVFAFCPPGMDEAIANKLLNLTLDSFCVYSGYKSSPMIIIATTKNLAQFKIGFIKNVQPFSKEYEKQLMEDVKKLGWFTKHTEIKTTEYEYPGEEE